MRPASHLRGWFGRNGSAAIEYALILPALLLFIVGLMDTGRLLWSYATLSRAVEAAARCAALNTTQCGTVGQTQTFAVSQAWGMTVGTAAFSVTTVACGKKVSGTYAFVFVMPGINVVVPTGTMTLTASACYPT